ncbi:hypothetical protein FFF34_016195 [Inquilinus sp. KBS0705]|nr:hypothetical protein FFF34_016195 [Inquilinus sp. KBS0705]
MQPLFAQTKKTAKAKELHIAMQAAAFDTTKQKVEYVNYKGVNAMKILPGNQLVTLKGVDFTNGTIEFDAEPLPFKGGAFLSVYFRQQNPNQSELVYLRCKPDETEQRNDAIQYAPILHGVNLWDMMNHYQAPAAINNTGWNHFKLVISGMQMLVYLNDMAKPTLQIPRLEGDTQNGSIAFDGQAYFANLVIKPNETEWLSPQAGADLTDHDVNYIRRWDVTTPRQLEAGQEFLKDDMPNDTSKFEPILAERRGLINLTRKFGGVENRGGGVQNKNRFVWLKTNIHSKTDQVIKMQLGFSDFVHVYINGGLLYMDKNDYPQPIRKYPDGRLDIANTTFEVPLKAGNNLLMVRVTNYFYGWGMVARVMNMNGITIQQK